MATYNAYLAYKRDIQHLVYWIIHASNSIVNSVALEETEPSVAVNTTGKITLPVLVFMSKLIAKHIKPIPPLIYHLFHRILGARCFSCSISQQGVIYNVNNPPDPEMENNYALTALGGDTWAAEQRTSWKDLDHEGVLEGIIFSQKFSNLKINGPEDDEGDEDGNDDERQTRPGRGKKGKKTNLDEVPLESYQIVEADSATTANYLMAIHALWKEWCELRSFLQNTWPAGQVSNMAIAMIKRSESAIFAGFPGLDSYEAVMQAAVGDNIDKVQRKFTLNLFAIGLDPTRHEGQDIIIKEQLMMYAYHDLVDFVTDFQKTRSGVPTPSMMEEISTSKEQRLKWRRSYTINWLYDLRDWSSHGKWYEHRRLFGLNEFAGVVTTLAMQEPGTNFKYKILPHHVFQLQCIVDSMTISRGWWTSGLRGHVVGSPAPDFHPRRDLDQFLDGAGENGKGFLLGAIELKKTFDRDAKLHDDPNRHKADCELLSSLQDDFAHWLGTSKYKYGLQTIAPSRFSNTDSNGLWEYSPFLCGVGMSIWDRAPELMMLYINQPINTYAALQAIDPTAFFGDGKVPGFDSRAYDFREAFLARTQKYGLRRAVFSRSSIVRAIRKGDVHTILDPDMNRFFRNKPHVIEYRRADWDLKRILDEDGKLDALAKLKMELVKQPTEAPPTNKGKERERYVDKCDHCGLGSSCKHDGDFAEMSSVFPGSRSEFDLSEPEDGKALDSKGRTTGSTSDIDGKTGATTHSNEAGDGINFSGRSLLQVLKHDIVSEVCGNQFHLSFNPISILAFCNDLFERVEVQLEKKKDPLYLKAYGAKGVASTDKRSALTALALYEQDDECLKVMAEAFQNPRPSFLEFIYWDEMSFTENTADEMADEDVEHEREVGSEACAVM
ncbi:hypothetical protein F5Y13DRAFT_203428 [Hypoxylon sp. FL1857]|nr:hypothetical protein F5Y13DRAFT_203428 [Hypoxylon sp. FL1857]